MEEKKLNYEISKDGCYLTLEDGRVFEQVRGDLACLDIELSDDVVSTLDLAVKTEHYVSRQELIRAALRSYMKTGDNSFNLKDEEKKDE